MGYCSNGNFLTDSQIWKWLELVSVRLHEAGSRRENESTHARIDDLQAFCRATQTAGNADQQPEEARYRGRHEICRDSLITLQFMLHGVADLVYMFCCMYHFPGHFSEFVSSPTKITPLEND